MCFFGAFVFISIKLAWSREPEPSWEGQKVVRDRLVGFNLFLEFIKSEENVDEHAVFNRLPAATNWWGVRISGRNKANPRCALQPTASPQIVAAYLSSVAPLISLSLPLPRMLNGSCVLLR